MSKPKTGSKKPSFSAAIEAKAVQIIENLKQHYESGKADNRARKRYAPIDAESPTNSNTLRKNRLFARTYSAGEFKELCDLRREKSGLPLHWGHVVFLLKLADDHKLRSELQNEAALNDWSAAELLAHIKRHCPDLRQETHGRRLKMPPTSEARMDHMILETERWLSRHDHVWMDEANGILTQQKGLKKGSLQKPLKGLVASLRKMATAAAEAANVLESHLK